MTCKHKIFTLVICPPFLACRPASTAVSLLCHALIRWVCMSASAPLETWSLLLRATQSQTQKPTCQSWPSRDSLPKSELICLIWLLTFVLQSNVRETFLRCELNDTEGVGNRWIVYLHQCDLFEQLLLTIILQWRQLPLGRHSLFSIAQTLHRLAVSRIHPAQGATSMIKFSMLKQCHCTFLRNLRICLWNPVLQAEGEEEVRVYSMPTKMLSRCLLLHLPKILH